jgi:hypothetical protein
MYFLPKVDLITMAADAPNHLKEVHGTIEESSSVVPRVLSGVSVRQTMP